MERVRSLFRGVGGAPSRAPGLVPTRGFRYAVGMSEANEVLEFWLGPEASREAPAADVVARWWKKDPAFDREIEARFGEAVKAAKAGSLAPWTSTPRGRLAVVILLDQFTRNIYRNSALMYEGDVYALGLVEAGLEAEEDRSLAAAERYFLYMPLMHAENLKAQERCVELFDELVKVAPTLGDAAKYARAHRDIVARFGRFPHRNVLVGRASTDEETAFLLEPGSSF